MALPVIAALASASSSIMSVIQYLFQFFHTVFGKLMVIGVLAILWETFFKAMMLPVLRLVQFLLSFFFYPMLTDGFLEFAWDVIVTLSTIKILMWVFGGGVEHPGRSEAEIYGNRRIPGVHAPSAEGFSSRNIPL